MILHFALHIIFLIIFPISPLISAQDGNGIIAHPGCNSRCGSVDISFPFGMKDPKCYADKWFEVECRRTSNTSSRARGVDKPYLKSLNLEVYHIDAHRSMVSIMNPIYRSNCQRKSNNNKAVINLRRSPFIYSQENTFLGVGCNNLAFLQSNGTTVCGCVSICDDDNNFGFGSDGCHGRYCCETSLPTHLSEYNATLQHLGEQSTVSSSNSHRGDQCSYALIVSNHWLLFQDYAYDFEIQNFNDLKNMDYAPAMLEWEILNDMLINSTLQLPSDSHCYGSNVTSSTNKTSGRRCRCSYGYDGNPYVAGGCTEASAGGFFDYDKNNRTKKSAIVGVSSSLGSIALLIGLWFLHKDVKKKMIKKRKEKFFRRNGGLLLQQRMSSGEFNVDKTILFSLKDLKKATDNFNMNRVLGKGGQGTVYKGMLVDGRIVAVKKFKVEGKVEEFINEFVILSQINNRNVVKLLGCCLETEIPLLVYEFIPNGNLFEYLHDQNEDLPMTWEMRLRIAAEIAGALYYLHSIASQPIYHRDIKTTNILLDEKYRAKLADFGASRIISIEATHLTTVVRGTFGYLDPEYFHSSQFTEKSDVYSFGVVLGELLTGHKPILSTGSGEYQNLASYFVQCMEENILFDIIDKRVTKEGEKEHIVAVANLAHRCLKLNGRKRPTMKDVMLELEGIRGLDRKSNAQPNNEEFELVGIEEYPPWSIFSASNSLLAQSNRFSASNSLQAQSNRFSTSNSLPTRSNRTLSSDSEAMHILALK